jgi:hypothetical protein
MAPCQNSLEILGNERFFRLTATDKIVSSLVIVGKLKCMSNGPTSLGKPNGDDDEGVAEDARKC